jgi:hypothetical protein
MKTKWFLICYIIILPAVTGWAAAQAGTWVGPGCSLAWDHPTPDVVQEYRIYIDGVQALATPDQSAACADLGLVQGAYIAHVTAANPTGESGPSNTVPFVYTESAPDAPTGVVILP